jgi:hypothetical protein
MENTSSSLLLTGTTDWYLFRGLAVSHFGLTCRTFPSSGLRSVRWKTGLEKGRKLAKESQEVVYFYECTSLVDFHEFRCALNYCRNFVQCAKWVHILLGWNAVQKDWLDVKLLCWLSTRSKSGKAWIFLLRWVFCQLPLVPSI